MNEEKNNKIKDLILRYREGEIDALEELMLLTYKDLFLLAYGYLKDKMLAEDVVSETFLKLIEKAGAIKNDQNLRGFLNTIAINRSLDIIRKRKREVCLENAELDRRTDGTDTEQIKVRTALSEIENTKREILLLWYYGYTLHEISAETGSTVNQTRLLLKKAKKNFLREYHKNNAGGTFLL